MRRKRKCLCCGKEFTASSGIQKYCSVDCAKAAKQARKRKRANLLGAVEQVADLSQVEYLTISKAATLMGCSRQYVYKLVRQGRLRASRLSNRMSYIRRADIEALLAVSPYTRVIPYQRPKPADACCKSKRQAEGDQAEEKETKRRETDGKGTDGGGTIEPLEFYSAEDVMRLYKINRTWLYTCAKRYGIRTCRIAGHTYYDKRDIDEYFGTALDYSDIDEWLTAEEVRKRCHVTKSSFRTSVYRHKIPTKLEYGITYYSKRHVDNLYKPDLLADKNYCTTEEACNILGVTSANLHHIVRRHGIITERVGVRNLLLRSDVVRASEERREQGLCKPNAESIPARAGTPKMSTKTK